MTTDKGGAPKGTVNNPSGKNQYAGELAEKPLTIRLPKDVDFLLRQIPSKERNALIREAIAEKLGREAK
ncbi:hypothetical protein [Coleofasciculus sp. FACHB-501]|uniref:hypothetical protein n=1 Tax=Cyanophyceae TaxID=3028117 RepID=UPI001689F1E6|nr:hypothetical protein [Coleofasciculus sp. FACHB-501]MBD1836666.1 hypothetical protein [Coleofasciculus sp. FACHB-501]